MVNKYQRWYNSLIFKAKNRNNNYGYYESHFSHVREAHDLLFIIKQLNYT
jgi:hypothetical protein